MSFAARLSTDEITVEAGATTPLSVEIKNESEASVQFEISVEGLDGEWTALPSPLVNVGAGETLNEKIFLKPPRVSESSAGSYPFVVKVRSFETNEVKTPQCTLTIKPYHHLSVEFAQKRGSISPFSKNNTFDLNIMNLGNTSHNVQLFANDPEDAIAFEFDTEKLLLEPGQQKSALVTATPRSSKLLGGRLYVFSVGARSVEHPNLMVTAQAQLEQKPLISVGLLLFLAVVALVMGLWAALIPKPPQFQLTSDATTLVQGQSVTIRWQPASADETVHISALNATIYDGPGQQGQVAYTPPAPGTVAIEGYALKNGVRSSTEHLVFTVDAPQKVLDPVIDEFKIDSTHLEIGQKVTIHYKVENAVKATLVPLALQLDLSTNAIEITPDNPRLTEYTLTAVNSAGKSVSRSIQVKITQPSKAKVIAFSADNASLTGPGQVSLSWQVNDQSVRVELSDGQTTRLVEPTGSETVLVNQTTTYTLIAYDDAGLVDKKLVKVVVKLPPPPADSTGGPPPIDGGGTGQNGTGGPGNGTGGGPPGVNGKGF